MEIFGFSVSEDTRAHFNACNTSKDSLETLPGTTEELVLFAQCSYYKELLMLKRTWILIGMFG